MLGQNRVIDLELKVVPTVPMLDARHKWYEWRKCLGAVLAEHLVSVTTLTTAENQNHHLPFPNGATNYQLILPDKGRAIKGLVVYNVV